MIQCTIEELKIFVLINFAYAINDLRVETFGTYNLELVVFIIQQ